MCVCVCVLAYAGDEDAKDEDAEDGDACLGPEVPILLTVTTSKRAAKEVQHVEWSQ